MKRLLLCFALAASAANAVESGDRIVLNDQTWVLIHESDWGNITNRVAMLEGVAADRWQKQHSTDAGRRAWHGMIKHTTVTNGETHITYADGYTYTEAATPTRLGRARTFATNSILEQARQKTESEFAKRRAAKRAARLAALKAKPKEVTVTIER